MKTMVPIGMFVFSNFCAVMMGPMVLVCKWKANSSKDLENVNFQYFSHFRLIVVYWKCTL